MTWKCLSQLNLISERVNWESNMQIWHLLPLFFFFFPSQQPHTWTSWQESWPCCFCCTPVENPLLTKSIARVAGVVDATWAAAKINQPVCYFKELVASDSWGLSHLYKSLNWCLKEEVVPAVGDRFCRYPSQRTVFLLRWLIKCASARPSPITSLKAMKTRCLGEPMIRSNHVLFITASISTSENTDLPFMYMLGGRAVAVTHPSHPLVVIPHQAMSQKYGWDLGE